MEAIGAAYIPRSELGDEGALYGQNVDTKTGQDIQLCRIP
jgi:hypothetical protein